MLRKLIAPAVLAGALVASSADAQAWNYPSFQTPTREREFNFAFADGGGYGTSLLFQWRVPVQTRSQLSLDAGMADPDGGDTYIVLGGQYGYQMARATRDMPLDLLLTAGFNAAIGDPSNVMRVPVGVSVGHRIPLEGQMAITPYAHPRLAIDHCTDCGPDGGETEMGLNFDVGANFEFTPQMAIRVSAGFGGSDLFNDDGTFGISLAWSPAGARSGRPGRR